MLVPLEEYAKETTCFFGILPLVSIVTDIVRKAWIGKCCASSSADDLTSEESAGIILYSIEWTPHQESLYFILNSTLREENSDLLKGKFLHLKFI